MREAHRWAPDFLSLGCGDGTTEIEIARYLHTNQLHDFEFVCLDLSPALLERFRTSIPPAFATHFTLRAEDLNRLTLDAGYNAVMANHSLHHMLDLERLFTAIHACLQPRGVFVTADMIGRNGHMRWPEAKLFVDFFWPLLTHRQRQNLLLRRSEVTFLDHDCSTEGFEGIRAQDILPLILAAGFHPRQFFGFGGFIDVFVDRCFGHNLSVEDPNDLFVIRRMGFLNELLLDAGLIKPTIMLAHFVKYETEQRCYRGRTAEASIRPPDANPAWLDDAQADFAAASADPGFTYAPGLAELRAELAAKDAMIQALQASTSWRLTAPLRALRRSGRR